MVDTVTFDDTLSTAAPTPAVITTSAVSVDLNPLEQVYHITTGGTAGEELLNLPPMPYTQDSWANGELVGRGITIVLVAQTDPADTVRITVEGSAGTYVYGAGIGESALYNNPSLGYMGAALHFVWALDQWYLDPTATDFCFDGDPQPYGMDLSAESASDDSSAVSYAQLRGGSIVNNDNPNNAGDAKLRGGGTDGAGNGGNALISGGSSSSGAGGNVVILTGEGATTSGGFTVNTGASASGAIGDIVLQPGQGNEVHAGGMVTISAGAGGGSTQTGGIAQFVGGSGFFGGAAHIQGGQGIDVGGAMEARGGDTSGDGSVGGAASLVGGAGVGVGGTASVTGGNALPAGQGGDVVIEPGQGGAGTYGHIIINHLPTSDPVYAGVLWNDAGTLKISTGA